MAVETRRKSDISKDKNKPMADIDSKKEKNPAVPTKTRKNLHLLRKVFHALAGILMAAAYQWTFPTRPEAIYFFAVFFATIASGEIARLYFIDSAVSKFVFRFMSILARNYETKHASGMVFFVAGVLSVIFLFPKKVAILAILFLSFGDPCASAAGIRFGSLGPKFSNGKSFIGTLGGALACAVTAFLYNYHPDTGVSRSVVLVSLLGGISGAIPETLCGRVHNGEGGPIDVDDNLAVPIGSGLIYYAFLNLFGLDEYI